MSKRVWFVIVALLAYLATGLAQIQPHERGVVSRFGKIVGHAEPGLRIGWPWGIERLDRVSVRTVHQITVGEAEDGSAIPYLTGDQNLVNARLIVEYTINPQNDELDRYVAEKDRVDASLARETESLAGEWIAAKQVDELLLVGRNALARHLLTSLPQRLAEHRLGIVIQRVNVESLAPPEAVREAFVKVNQAQSEMVTKENQARQEVDRRLREAETIRHRFAQQAEAYRTERETLARSEAASFSARLVQYQTLTRNNPDLLQSIWWDETGRILLGMKGRGRIDLLDSHLGKDGLDLNQFLPQKK